MARLLLTLFLAAGVAATARAQDLHLSESGSAAVLSHSAFAHGYRHGYEEGYHVGNADVSLGSSQRQQIKDFHGLKLGYSSQFGPRKLFEHGFAVRFEGRLPRRLFRTAIPGRRYASVCLCLAGRYPVGQRVYPL